jgi:DNA-binding NtrC family response regulator
MSGWPVDFTPLFPLREAPHRTVDKMPQEKIGKSVLLAVDDLGFALWAGRILADAGYPTWPAKTVSDALKWIEESGTNFRLLLIDPSLPGALYLVQTARRKYSGLKVALLREAGDPPDIGADAVISKPADVDSPDMVSAWVEKIVRLTSEH